VASALDVPPAAITGGLTEFASSAAANPGRANLWDVNGARVIVDFAHNPHGLRAMVAMAMALDAGRRAIVIGQAGDRDDGAIAELARVAAALEPDRVFVKEMDHYLRGRAPGEVPGMIARELAAAGLPAAAVSHHPSELDAVRAALAWARPTDLVLLTVHEDRDAVTALLAAAGRTGAAAG
jgi:UDP-N-acetylmuramyl tripeptide synthase